MSGAIPTPGSTAPRGGHRRRDAAARATAAGDRRRFGPTWPTMAVLVPALAAAIGISLGSPASSAAMAPPPARAIATPPSARGSPRTLARGARIAAKARRSKSARARRRSPVRAPGATAQPATLLGVTAGYAAVAGDHLATATATVDHLRGDLALRLVAPLRLRVLDEAPRDARPHRELRHLDWDEPSEWLRWLRRFDYGRSGEAFYLRVGELSGATLGHGALVQGYHNALASDHHRSGLRLDLDEGQWGLQLLSNDLVTWEVTAARLFWRPMDGLRMALARSLTLGLSFAADRSAPLAPRLDAAGRRTYDRREVQLVDRTFVPLFGVDLGVELWRSTAVAVVPYLDLSGVRTGGRLDLGLHTGLSLHLRPGDPLFEMTMRYEWRLEQGAWKPGWIGPQYEVDRFQHASPGSDLTHATRLGWLRALGSQGQQRRSHLGSVDLRVRRDLRVSARYEHSESFDLDNATVLLRLPPTREVEIDAFGAWWPGADDRGHVVVAAAAIRYHFMRPLFVRFEYQRAWHVIGEADRRLGVTDDMAFGLGALSTF